MLNIFKMHAWLWNDKVKVQVHFEGLIDSILPIAFQKGCILHFHEQLIMLECQSYHILTSTSNHLKTLATVIFLFASLWWNNYFLIPHWYPSPWLLLGCTTRLPTASSPATLASNLYPEILKHTHTLGPLNQLLSLPWTLFFQVLVGLSPFLQVSD